MNLKNLNELALRAKLEYSRYNHEEIELSEVFKKEFSNLLVQKSNDTISYSVYSSLIKTSTGLTISFPNQWFFIASYFVEFVSELKEYKK